MRITAVKHGGCALYVIQEPGAMIFIGALEGSEHIRLSDEDRDRGPLTRAQYRFRSSIIVSANHS